MKNIFQYARKFPRQKSGNVSVEFALVGPMFLSLIFAILGHSIVAVQVGHLDFITYQAATVLKLDDLGSASANNFKNSVLCADASPLLSCDDIEFGVVSDSDFRALQGWRQINILGQFCPGEAQDIVLISTRYKVNKVLKNAYFGFSDVEDDGTMYVSSRYVVAREPVITDPKLC